MIKYSIKTINLKQQYRFNNLLYYIVKFAKGLTSLSSKITLFVLVCLLASVWSISNDLTQLRVYNLDAFPLLAKYSDTRPTDYRAASETVFALNPHNEGSLSTKTIFFTIKFYFRTQLLTEAFTQVSLTISLYRLYLLIIDVGQRKVTKSPELMLRVGPCCCWPCLPFPVPQMTDSNLSWLGISVLQLPIIQVIHYVLCLFFNSRNIAEWKTPWP